MGEDPDTIRDEIADTRERMGDTIDALGYKADVKSRAKDNVAGKVDSVKESLGLAGQKASDVTPDAEQVKGQARKAAGRKSPAKPPGGSPRTTTDRRAGHRHPGRQTTAHDRNP